MAILKKRFFLNNQKAMSHQAKNLRYATCSSLFMGSSKHLVCDMTISMLIFCILGIFGAPLTQIFILIACKLIFWVIGIYVDDRVIVSNDLAYLDVFKSLLAKSFAM
jgi:hypothetical protein